MDYIDKDVENSCLNVNQSVEDAVRILGQYLESDGKASTPYDQAKVDLANAYALTTMFYGNIIFIQAN